MSLTDWGALMAYYAAVPRLSLELLTDSAANRVPKTIAEMSLCRGSGYAVEKKSGNLRDIYGGGLCSDADLGRALTSWLEQLPCRWSAPSSIDIES
jgi:hypothetical protein